ncbi:MAG: hypothetical protein MI924_29165 [Chloroflexales bacterium]|nr:hypothetical protein [Chloroflexales bacterium]
MVEIDTKVIVNEFIAHSRDGRSGDLRSQISRRWRDPFDRLANDFELSDHAILDQALCVKGRFVDAPKYISIFVIASSTC